MVLANRQATANVVVANATAGPGRRKELHGLKVIPEAARIEGAMNSDRPKLELVSLLLQHHQHQ